MSSRLIFEVRQRVQEGSISHGFFTDAAMANQMVDYLYRGLWNVVNKTPLPYSVSPELAAAVRQEGIDTFMSIDKNVALPTFFVVPATIYNAIPVVGENLEVTTVNQPFTLFDALPQV